jgi:hypothetical protein
MLRDLLRSRIEAEPDIEVADEVLHPVDVLLAVKQTGADVVLVTVPVSDATPPLCTHLLAEFPDLVVIGLWPEAQTAVAYRNALDIEPLNHAFYEDIVGAIRTATCST